MNEPDIDKVERHLAALLQRERREAIAYTLATVLATPFFVILGSTVSFVLLAYIFMPSNYYYLDASAIYTGINLFLGFMVVSTLSGTSFPCEIREIDKTWLAAVCVYFALLFLTYGTPLYEHSPVFFGIVYAIVGFLVLALLGHVYMNRPITENLRAEQGFLSLVLAVAGFIAMAYAELLCSSWLWIPPRPDELRLGAWILCKLAAEQTNPLDSGAVKGRILRPLRRLKLVQVTENGLSLTPKGMNFVKAAIQDTAVTTKMPTVH
jgi:hypothetical protein